MELKVFSEFDPQNSTAYILNDGGECFPFTKEEIEEFVLRYFSNKSYGSIVSLPNSDFYLILVQKYEGWYRYLDKSATFNTFGAIHIN